MGFPFWKAGGGKLAGVTVARTAQAKFFWREVIRMCGSIYNRQTYNGTALAAPPLRGNNDDAKPRV
jgi:hypothetical protein